MNLVPPSEHHVLVFFVALLALFVAARVLGRLAQAVGQPAVVGELAAGVLIGPSGLGAVAPDVASWLFPDDEVQTAMLFTVGWLGVAFLLVSTGAETDLGLIRRLGRAAAVVSVTSLAVPLGVGYALGLVIPEVLMGTPDHRQVFALFIAAALGISSLPVMAKILAEMRLLRRDFAQLTLAAGMVNDVLGWVLLGTVAGVARGGRLEISSLTQTLIGVTVFFVVAFTIGQLVLDRLLRAVRRGGNDVQQGVAALLAVTIALGAVTQWLGVEALLGAFVTGILFRRSRFADHDILQMLETVTFGFFAPVFFATAGLRVDLALLGDPTVAVWAVVVVAAAAFGKFAGAFLGGHLARLGLRESAAMSIGLNARGALEIVIATIGLSLGILNDRSYSIIVVMAIATSVMAPPLLRLVLRGWDGSSAEQARLAEEETLRSNSVVRAERILLPSEADPSSIVAAQIVDLVWPEDIPATVLTVDTAAESLRPVVASFGHRPVEVKRIRQRDVASAVLDEAKLGYGVIAMGAPSLASDGILSPLVDQLLACHAVPLVLARRAPDHNGRLPWAHSRAVVPVTGGESARAAQELAFGLSSRIGTEILLTNVIEPSAVSTVPRRTDERNGSGSASIAHQLFDEAEVLAARTQARTRRVMRTDASVAQAICDLVDETESDLVVMGATRRSVGRSFLGHTIEQVLERCDATVVVVVTPPRRSPGDG